MESILENKFYGVYLLCSESIEKRFKGKCYIGFTVNPVRRIRQHNRGVEFGGARKTNNRGPWTMVLIVCGFPNNISALQFEWAWQQPSLSFRLKQFVELKRKRTKETYLEYNMRILEKMLNVGPWDRLPLTIQWLNESYQNKNLISLLQTTLPIQMKINLSEDNVLLDNNKKKTISLNLPADQIGCSWLPKNCHLCMKPITSTDPETTQKRYIGCCRSTCKLICHLICLANYLISQDSQSVGHYIPIKGRCPLCDVEFLWIDLLRNQQNNVQKMNGTDAEVSYMSQQITYSNQDQEQNWNQSLSQELLEEKDLDKDLEEFINLESSDEDLEKNVHLNPSSEYSNSNRSTSKLHEDIIMKNLADKFNDADIVELSD